MNIGNHSWCFFVFLLFFCGCNAEKVKKEAPMFQIKNGTSNDNLGQTYTDSSIQILINQHHSALIQEEIDTSEVYRIKSDLFLNQKIEQFNKRTMKDLLHKLVPVTDAQKKVFGVSHYFVALPMNDSSSLTLFYNDQTESHYGPSIELLVLNLSQFSFEKFVLFQEYHSEGYEYEIESKLVHQELEIIKTERFNNHTNIIEDDSMSVQKVRYSFSDLIR